MSVTNPCPECGSEKVYRYKKSLKPHGGDGYSLIPGTGWLTPALWTPIVCTSCGLVRFFVTETTGQLIEESKHWVRV